MSSKSLLVTDMIVRWALAEKIVQDTAVRWALATNCGGNCSIIVPLVESYWSVIGAVTATTLRSGDNASWKTWHMNTPRNHHNIRKPVTFIICYCDASETIEYELVNGSNVTCANFIIHIKYVILYIIYIRIQNNKHKEVDFQSRQVGYCLICWTVDLLNCCHGGRSVGKQSPNRL